MRYIRERVLQQEPVSGIWCGLASSVSAEMIGLCGYDWVLLDQEHSPSTGFSLLGQMQALGASQTAPIVRVPWLDRIYSKNALDLGAAGIMFPNIDTPGLAKEAVSHLRYPPHGIRGVGGSTRCSGYGFSFGTYFPTAADNLLCVVQIENGQAVENCEAIAAVDGVDVLFVGPMDLGAAVEMPERFNDVHFTALVRRVADAARNENKAAGILLADAALVPFVAEMGYTFVALGQDVSVLAKGLKSNLQTLRQAQQK